jgi:hypothetical protein
MEELFDEISVLKILRPAGASPLAGLSLGVFEIVRLSSETVEWKAQCDRTQSGRADCPQFNTMF